MEGKGIENRIYQIIIICLLIILIIFLVKGETGHYQISEIKFLIQKREKHTNWSI